MVDNHDLERLCAALDSGPTDLRATEPLLALRRLLLQLERLDEPARAALDRATHDLHPVIQTLEEAAKSGSLAPDALRDLSTLRRRLEVSCELLRGRASADPSRGEALRVSYAPLDLAALLEQAREALRELAADRGLAFEVSVSSELPSKLVIEADREKLELVLAALLHGAFKHTPVGGRIRLAASLDSSLEAIVIAAEDDGPPPACLPEELFDRSRETERSVALHLPERRVSLGLARDLVALHGGTLDLVPAPRGGLRLELRLPRRAPRGIALHRAPAPSRVIEQVAAITTEELRKEQELGERPLSPHGRPMVLVVASSRPLNRAIVEALEPELATASVFDERGGVEHARMLHPDLVVVDVATPEVDGEAFVRTLRSDEELDAAVLVITGTHDGHEGLRLLDLGAHDLVPKPLRLEELRARALRLLATKQTHDVLGETLGQRDTDLVALANEVAETHHDLARANAELEAARERAERMNEIKSNFLRIMSHELKTPVTAMKLQLSVLETDPEVEHTPVLDRGLERLARSTGRLLRLVDTVLEWARVEDGRCRPEVERFDMIDLVEEVAAELDGNARMRQLELVVEAEPGRPRTAVSDRRLVRLVVINLVERAISVSTDARIEIRVSGDDGRLHVGVHDRGPTMSELQRAEVFDPLKQTRDFHRLSGAGSGLGVYALRDIARAVEGEIRWEADGEPGNLFVFDVPALEPTTSLQPVRSPRRSLRLG